MRLPEGTYLQNGKFQVVSVLGQGGYGITYLAINTAFGIYVAIKEFYPGDFCQRDPDSLLVTTSVQANADFIQQLKRKFLKEAKGLYNINCDNIVKVSDYFEENGTAYLVMEYIQGEPITAIVKRLGPMPEHVAVNYILQIASALHYIHSMKMAHFDVKPDNIMVRQNDNRAILIDFGLSKQFDRNNKALTLTPIGISNGFTPLELYGSIEGVDFSPKIDIYALGATLYYMVTGLIPPLAAKHHENPSLEFPYEMSQNMYNAIYMSMEPMAAQRPETMEHVAYILGQPLLPYAQNLVVSGITPPPPVEPGQTPVTQDDPQHEFPWLDPEAYPVPQTPHENIAQSPTPPPQSNKASKRNKSGSNTLWIVITVVLSLLLGGIITALIIELTGDDYTSESEPENTEEIVNARIIAVDNPNENPYKFLSERRVAPNELSNKTKPELLRMRYAIYAMHGMHMPNKELTDYFSQFNWYKPLYYSANTVAKEFNDFESYNVDMIKVCEDKQN